MFSSFLGREADEGCKKPLERLLNIWQERSVYGGEFIQQLKLSMEDSKSPPPKGRDITTCLQLLVFAYFRIKYEKLQWGLLWTTSDFMILQRWSWMMVRIYVVLGACQPGSSTHAAHPHTLPWALYSPCLSSVLQRLCLHMGKEQQNWLELRSYLEVPWLRFYRILS